MKKTPASLPFLKVVRRANDGSLVAKVRAAFLMAERRQARAPKGYSLCIDAMAAYGERVGGDLLYVKTEKEALTNALALAEDPEVESITIQWVSAAAVKKAIGKADKWKAEVARQYEAHRTRKVRPLDPFMKERVTDEIRVTVTLIDGTPVRSYICKDSKAAQRIIQVAQEEGFGYSVQHAPASPENDIDSPFPRKPRRR